VPIFILLTIVFITSGSIVVSYVAAKAYLKEGLPAMLFLGSGSLIFGSTSLIAAVAALSVGQAGSNPGTTIFIIGALVSSALHLLCVESRSLGTTRRAGSRPLAVLTFVAVLLLTASVIVAAFDGLLPAFLVPGVGASAVAKGVLSVAIVMLALASARIAVSSSRSSVLYWYSSALAMTTVGLLGILLSNWTFQALVFSVGRLALCVGGAYLILSVRSAEKQAPARPDSAVEELFRPAAAPDAGPRPVRPRTLTT
jgi:hypothetical protein